MKHTQRPAWMGPVRRAPENKPAPSPTEAPRVVPEQGYDPYDTVRARKLLLDAWEGKRKRD